MPATSVDALSLEGLAHTTKKIAIASFPKTPFFPTNGKGSAQGFH